MHVGALVLEDFRNYKHQRVELVEGLNLVVGRNAQGKTNLLEAVYRLSGLGSPRGPDAILVREGAELALIHADVTRKGRTVHVDMELRGGRAARSLINGNAVSSSKALGDLAVSVFFGPDELSLVKGSPDGRRKFLDDLVVKLRPAQQALRRDLDRALKQRNAFLRSVARGAPLDEDALSVWDESFSRAAVALAAARLRSLAALVPYATRRYQDVAGGGGLALTYVSSWCSPELADAALADPATIDPAALTQGLMKRIGELRRAELERGLTLAGPQRDDVNVQLDSPGSPTGFLDARSFASQGDQRTCALALKLGEHDLLTEELEDPPILLLDDVFSELDPKRRAWLREAVRDSGQTLLSSAETETWESLMPEAVFEVSQGVAELRSP